MRGRPLKYNSQIQRKAARKKRDAKRVNGKYWRLVIPALEGYGVSPEWDSPKLELLKQQTVDKLADEQLKRGLTGWTVAIEPHPGSGLPHLDILLVYSKSVLNGPKRYDYLIKHPNIQKYRTLNRAIVEYGCKSDSRPLSNICIEKTLLESQIKSGELYDIMEDAMVENPFLFNAHQWLNKQDLYRAASKIGMYKAIRIVNDRQQIICNNLLRQKPGIVPITRQLIESRLSPVELKQFDSWSGYQKIVDHLNQIPKWGCHRPHKTKNLLIVGRPDTGKTSLALKIEKWCPVYYKGVSNWFPSYRSGVYTMTLWNEFLLQGIPYSDTLNFLEGTKMDLQYKGGVTCRTDNQLTYMTSNLSLEQHICNRFRSEANRVQSRLNLRARITEVIIPDHLNLFLLFKLIQV